MARTYLSTDDALAAMEFIVSGGGGIDSHGDLFFSAPVKDGESFAAGSVVSLNSAGTIQAGLATATSLPMIAINGAADYDSGQYKYNLNKGGSTAVQAKVNCLPVTGAYELATTEYITTDNYTKGTTPLAANESTLGKICAAAAAYSLKAVLGTVSTGVQSTSSGINRARNRLSQTPFLHFWAHYQMPVNTEGGS